MAALPAERRKACEAGEACWRARLSRAVENAQRTATAIHVRRALFVCDRLPPGIAEVAIEDQSPEDDQKNAGPMHEPRHLAK